MEPTEIVQAVQEASTRRIVLMKAMVIGKQAESNVRQEGNAETLFQGLGTLAPPYDPETLCLLIEHSGSLRQCLEAYAVNIDGFGHRFEPTLPLYGPTSESAVKDELAGTGSTEDPTATAEEWKKVAAAEHARLRIFFDRSTAGEGYSFVSLRRRTRIDLETMGNAFWEVLRNKTRQVARFVYVPSQTVRLTPLDKEGTAVQRRERATATSYEVVDGRRRFRHFVQIVDGQSVYFKEFGDPRPISKRSGKVVEGGEFQDGDGPATEMMHFRVHSPRTAYGIPRWIGALLSVLGSRKAEEINLAYFDNKSVPPLAILVSGGRLAEDAIPRLENYIKEELQGSSNFHKILILEAESDPGGTGSVKVEIKPLTDAQYTEELFSKYDERNINKVGQAFRLPPILRGETPSTINRATALAAIRFTEEQVFQPERDDFDFLINTQIMADLGIRFWKFVSNSPVTRDPERMTAMTTDFGKVGALTPNEMRVLAEDVFNRAYPAITEPWGNVPLPILLAGMNAPPAAEGGEPPPEEIEGEGVVGLQIERLRREVRSLQLLRDHVDAQVTRVEDRLLEVDAEGPLK
jgi:PBSX family phage portal protein